MHLIKRSKKRHSIECPLLSALDWLEDLTFDFSQELELNPGSWRWKRAHYHSNITTNNSWKVKDIWYWQFFPEKLSPMYLQISNKGLFCQSFVRWHFLQALLPDISIHSNHYLLTSLKLSLYNFSENPDSYKLGLQIELR